MKNSFKKRVLAICAAGVLCAGCVGLSALCGVSVFSAEQSSAAQQAESGEVTLLGAEYAAEYAVGDMIDVQPGLLYLDGQTVEGTHEVRCPDGRSLRSDRIVLDTAGKYTVVYRAQLGGKIISASASFMAVGQAYSIDGAGGTVEYGAHPYAPDAEGLIVSLSRGNAFRCNRAIDLSGGTSSQNAFRMFVTPTVKGEADFLSFTVTFTDAYDSENYLSVRVNSSTDDSKLIYTAAAHSGEVLTGMDYSANTLHRGDEYGYVSSMDFCGNPDRPVERDVFEIYFDEEELSLHGARYASNPTLICDFDDPEYFTDLWSGFTTGEVFVSVQADSLQKDTANFVITNIGGLDLSEERLIDEDAPQIEVDFEEYSETDLPQAYEGLTYKVFDAQCFDAYRTDAQLYVRAFYDYGGEARTQVEIVDGRFLMDRAGEYTVEYRAEDGSGNLGVRTYTVECLGEENLPRADISEDCVVQAEVGELVPVAAAQVSGGSGNLILETKVICQENGEETPVQDGKFRPLYEGKYKIVYTVTDFLLQTVTQEYVFEALPAQAPVFSARPVLPSYLIAGMTCVFPECVADEYKGDGTIGQIAAQVTVDEGGTVKEGSVYVPPESLAGKSVTVTYTAKGERGEDRMEWTIPVVSVWAGGEKNLDLTKYFVYGEDVELTSSNDKITAVTHREGAELSFIRMLMADNFSFKFEVDADRNNFTAMTMILEDAADPSVKLKISFTKKDDRITGVCVGGKEYGTIESDFFGYGTGFDFSYDPETGAISAGNASLVFVPESFGGFPSGWVNFSARFDGVTGESAVFFKEICKQPLTSVARDAIKPNIIVNEDAFSGIRKIKSKATIPAAAAYDVLDTYVEFTLSVYAPDGSVVKDEDGRELEKVPGDAEYMITLTSYGYYTLRYEATDGSNRKQTLNYATWRTTLFRRSVSAGMFLFRRR